MINLDLIEFADLVRPIEIVNLILHQNQWITGAIPLEEIAEAAGIQEIQYTPLNSFEGTLVANDTKTQGIIVINNSVKLHRQRFTLGHELGHFMIPRHGHQMQCSKADVDAKTSKTMTSRLTIEVEANQFSAELLLPVTLVKKQPAFKKEPSIESIKVIADLFQVSFQASALRFANLHDYPIALIISQHGKVLWGYKRQDHPFWLKLGNKGNQIPAKTVTGTIDPNKPETIISDEGLSSLWFDANRYYELPERCIEEAYVQEDGYIVTILWFEDEIVEK